MRTERREILIEDCNIFSKKILERRKEVDINIYPNENIRERLNQFKIITTGSSRLYYYEWGLFGDAELYYHVFPEGTQFSWRSSKIEEIQSFTHPDDVFVLNDFDDIAKTFFLDKYHFQLDEREWDAPLSIIKLQKRFGNSIPDNLLGFENFEKSMFFHYDGNATFFIGYKSGYFFYIKFFTS